MSTADPLFAQWLMSASLQHVEADTTLIDRWGATAVATSRVTTIAVKADAEAEAQRQIDFLGGTGPIVIEEHQLAGVWAPYQGQVITLTIDRLGYDDGLDVFLLGAQDNRATGLSTITVARRL